MAINLNEVTLAGNVVAKPELKTLESGQQVAAFNIAINNTYKNSKGEKVESVDFIQITVFGKTAENIVKYLEKGQNVLVKGKIKNSSFEKDGVKIYKTSIIADHVYFGQRAGLKDTQGQSKGHENSVEDKGQTYEYPQEQGEGEIPF